MAVSKKVQKHLQSIASSGGKALAEAMTEQQKIDRATAGGNAAASNMTAEQRTARARKAAQARFPPDRKTSSEATM